MIVALVAVAMLSANGVSWRTETALMVMRWVHLVAGITWVGLLYFFNLVNVPFLQELDAKRKSPS